MIVLGIESSCDETGLALVQCHAAEATNSLGNASLDAVDSVPQIELLSHALYSQVAMHAEFGGVVPELASRDHIKKLTPLLREVMYEAGVEAGDIGAVAYTAGPGLIGALFTGAAYARSLAFAWDVPAIPVHHMEGHLLAPMLEPEPPKFPFVALLVSGGHTMLVDVKGLGDYQVLGESLDDAVGEAFDKTAKLLGLPYPGGPALEKMANEFDVLFPPDTKNAFRFSRPMTDRPGMDFSFSGLKTQVYTHIQKHLLRDADVNLKQTNSRTESADRKKSHDLELSYEMKVHVASAFQEAVCDTLRIKCQRALESTGRTRLVVAGGVGANKALRSTLHNIPGVDVSFPRLDFCTDNGAMIAYAGALRLQQTQKNQLNDLMADLSIRAQPRWPLTDLV